MRKSGVRLLVFWCASVDAVGEQGGAKDPDVVAFAHGIGGLHHCLGTLGVGVCVCVHSVTFNRLMWPN